MTSPAAVRGQEVREKLLAAAVELIPERGWAAVSTRILAERAGVAPSVVHYHFSSLRALLTEAAISAMRRILGDVEALLENASGPDEVVDDLVASVEQYTGVDPMSLLFVEAYLASTREEALRTRIAELVDDMRGRLALFLETHGVRDPDGTAYVVLATVDGLLLHRALNPVPGNGSAAAVLRRLLEQEEEHR